MLQSGKHKFRINYGSYKFCLPSPSSASSLSPTPDRNIVTCSCFGSSRNLQMIIPFPLFAMYCLDIDGSRGFTSYFYFCPLETSITSFDGLCKFSLSSINARTKWIISLGYTEETDSLVMLVMLVMSNPRGDMILLQVKLRS